ncbi:MAG: AAA family ATPase [Bacteroidetes bacterium]|nr:MAG: AAA family ATPase [Bacteroidota bacterium]
MEFCEQLSSLGMVVTNKAVIHTLSKGFQERYSTRFREWLGSSWIGMDANLSALEWRTKWQTLQQEKILSYATSISFDGQQLQPAIVYLFAISADRAFLLLELRESAAAPKPGQSGFSRLQCAQIAQQFLDQADHFFVWFNDHRQLCYANKAALKLLGGSFRQWRNRSPEEVFPLLEEDPLAANQLTYSLLHAGGERVYLLLSIKPLHLGGKQYWGVSGYDVTQAQVQAKRLSLCEEKVQQLSLRLSDQKRAHKEEISEQYCISNIITLSPKYRKVLAQVAQVANTHTSVLILGETGTGKELLARAIHQLSSRANFPFIKLNCAALSASLIESELFGHEKGAFTGAYERRRGRFELAHGGTLFLDEIGELPLELQPKLLRVLQEQELERLGGTETIKVDVRIVAATNRVLEEMVKEGTFRSDLYYRLNVFPIFNLPLRQRPEDIKVLAHHFMSRFAKQQGKKIERIDPADLEALTKYHFPGNVRELENIIERAVVLCPGNTLRISLEPASAPQATQQYPYEFLSLQELERQHIIRALKKTHGRVSGIHGAARLLGINDNTLAAKIRKHKIEKTEYL